MYKYFCYLDVIDAGSQSIVIDIHFVVVIYLNNMPQKYQPTNQLYLTENILRINKTREISLDVTHLKVDLCLSVSKNGWHQLAINECTSKQIAKIS